MEIGFNAGHSAVLMLSANPRLKLTCFDINHHRYTKPCADFVKQVFGDRFTIVYGDSTVTVPKYAHEQQYDAVHIDGGHSLEIATKDWDNTYGLVRDGGLIVFDDTQVPWLDQLVRQKVDSAVVEDVSHIYESTHHLCKHAILRVKCSRSA